MARETERGIGWCDETWNPIRDKQGKWAGRVELIERELERPLHWRKPRRIAVALMGDWMHYGLPHEARDRILAVEAVCPQHVFIHLTKRWERQAKYFQRLLPGLQTHLYFRGGQESSHSTFKWPLPNVILGVSAWDQPSADEACHWLFRTPAVCRLLCLEPLLGPVDQLPYLRPFGDMCGRCGWVPVEGWEDYMRIWGSKARCLQCGEALPQQYLDWVRVGAETGPGARPMHPDWVRKIRDDCQAASVPFWFEDWGEWLPFSQAISSQQREAVSQTTIAGRQTYFGAHIQMGADGPITGTTPGVRPEQVNLVGKRIAGRLLDRRQWNEVPCYIRPSIQSASLSECQSR